MSLMECRIYKIILTASFERFKTVSFHYISFVISEFLNMKFFLSICLLASLALAEDIVLKIQKGNVRGKRVDDETGQYHYSFRGIRYAQPPVGKLRFMVRTILYILAFINLVTEI